jgi:hypothetical protein
VGWQAERRAWLEWTGWVGWVGAGHRRRPGLAACCQPTLVCVPALWLGVLHSHAGRTLVVGWQAERRAWLEWTGWVGAGHRRQPGRAGRVLPAHTGVCARLVAGRAALSCRVHTGGGMAGWGEGLARVA